MIEWVLRIGVFGTFLGHGIFALQGKEDWIPLITSTGMPESFAVNVLPVIGIVDILVAILTLIKPLKVILVWAIIWAFATALIRPIAGKPFWDFVERSANWATPLALLAIQGFPTNIRDLFKK